MSKYIASLIFMVLASSVSTEINMISGIKSNFTAQKQLQFGQQDSWEVLIAQIDETAQIERDDENITPGQERTDQQR
ncbi:hypothetical protein [Okeania sp.]|uniref:hypothetical protein n=1 Tax=Okeania sp. TaxID=3100323 RepID=UPI002B4B6566|nr:hypothetical protein [Okeania sp.]